MTVLACTTGEGNVLLRDCFAYISAEGNVLLHRYLRMPLVKQRVDARLFRVNYWYEQRVVA